MHTCAAAEDRASFLSLQASIAIILDELGSSRQDTDTAHELAVRGHDTQLGESISVGTGCHHVLNGSVLTITLISSKNEFLSCKSLISRHKEQPRKGGFQAWAVGNTSYQRQTSGWQLIAGGPSSSAVAKCYLTTPYARRCAGS
jgi:hypothetical protein